MNAFSRDQPPITRARAWENWNRNEIECSLEASELNHELAKVFNDLIKTIHQSNRDELNWYLRCYDELFGLLDTIFLLMIEPGTTLQEAKHIATATRRHFNRAVDRWHIHQRELRALVED